MNRHEKLLLIRSYDSHERKMNINMIASIVVAVVASIAYIYQVIFIDRHISLVHRQLDHTIFMMDSKMIVDVSKEETCRGERPPLLVDWCDCSSISEQLSKIYAVDIKLAKSSCTYDQIMSGCKAYRNEQLDKLCITRIDASFSNSSRPPCSNGAKDCALVCIPKAVGSRCPISKLSVEKSSISVDPPRSKSDGFIVNLFIGKASSRIYGEVVASGEEVSLLADRLQQSEPSSVRQTHEHLKSIFYPHIATTVIICIITWFVYPSLIIYVIYNKSDVQLSHLSAIIVVHLLLLIYSFHVTFHASFLSTNSIYGRSLIYSLVHLAACIAQLVSLVCLHRLSTLVMHIRSIMATI